MQGAWVRSLVGELDPVCHNEDPKQPNKEIFLKRKKEIIVFLYPVLQLPTHKKGLSGGSVFKESACNAGDPGRCRFDPWLGRFPGGGHGNTLQYFILAWRIPWAEEPGWATVHRAAKSQT